MPPPSPLRPPSRSRRRTSRGSRSLPGSGTAGVPGRCKRGLRFSPRSSSSREARTFDGRAPRDCPVSGGSRGLESPRNSCAPRPRSRRRSGRCPASRRKMPLPAPRGAAAAGEAAATGEAAPSPAAGEPPASAAEAAPAGPPAASPEGPPAARSSRQERKHDEEEQEEGEWNGAPRETRTAVSSRSLVHRGPRAFVLPLRRGDHRVHAGFDPARVIVCAEPRHDLPLNDPVRDGVGKYALEAVSDLDAQFPVVYEDEERGPVVLFRLADAPFLEGADGEILDREVLRELAVDPHDDLVRRVPLELLELPGERVHALGPENSSVVGDVLRRLRRELLLEGALRDRTSRGDDREENGQRDRPERRPAGQF